MSYYIKYIQKIQKKKKKKNLNNEVDGGVKSENKIMYIINE
jgi:pentose-5-phosphate-3-epimerase